MRFALTSEAGLKDGLAFPLMYAAVGLAAAAGSGWSAEWIGPWVAQDVAYKCTVGVLGGLLVGRLLGWLFFRTRSRVSATTDTHPPVKLRREAHSRPLYTAPDTRKRAPRHHSTHRSSPPPANACAACWSGWPVIAPPCRRRCAPACPYPRWAPDESRRNG